MSVDICWMATDWHKWLTCTKKICEKRFDLIVKEALLTYNRFLYNNFAKTKTLNIYNNYYKENNLFAAGGKSFKYYRIYTTYKYALKTRSLNTD